jgi:hypothetical protein
MELKARLPPLGELSRTCLSELLVSLAEVKPSAKQIDMKMGLMHIDAISPACD